MIKTKQSGSAHLIIVIILVLALVGALGYIAWDKFINNSASVNPDTATPGQVDSTKVAYDHTIGTNLAIKYPSSWGVANSHVDAVEAPGGDGEDSSVITSPDGSVKVYLNISNPSGYGSSSCPSNSMVTVLDSGKIVGYPTTKFVTYKADGGQAYSGSDYGGSFLYFGAVLTREIGGKTDCHSYFVARYLKPFSIKLSHYSIANVFFTKSGLDKDSSFEEIREFMATDNYKTAKQIIQSLYIKE